MVAHQVNKTLMYRKSIYTKVQRQIMQIAIIEGYVSNAIVTEAETKTVYLKRGTMEVTDLQFSVSHNVFSHNVFLMHF